jgi:hypothetical protein
MKDAMTTSLCNLFAIVTVLAGTASPAPSQTSGPSAAETNTSGPSFASPRFLAETTTLFRAETTVPELKGLDIGECVKVLNFKTNYQINLEARESEHKTQYALDLVALRTQPIEQVLSNLLNQTDDYGFVETNKTINIIPREQQGKTNLLDTVLPEYDVKQQSLVGAFEPLYQRLPEIALISPALIGSESKPEWVEDQKREMAFQGWPAFSLDLRAATVRIILNEIARESGNSFWISGPSSGNPPKWLWISILRRDYAKEILYKHDPGLHEQFEELMRKKKQDLERTHPTQ